MFTAKLVYRYNLTEYWSRSQTHSGPITVYEIMDQKVLVHRVIWHHADFCSIIRYMKFQLDTRAYQPGKFPVLPQSCLFQSWLGWPFNVFILTHVTSSLFVWIITWKWYTLRKKALQSTFFGASGWTPRFLSWSF